MIPVLLLFPFVDLSNHVPLEWVFVATISLSALEIVYEQIPITTALQMFQLSSD